MHVLATLLRSVVRIGGTYYVSLPKIYLSEVGIYKGSSCMFSREGSRLTMEFDSNKFFPRKGIKK